MRASLREAIKKFGNKPVIVAEIGVSTGNNAAEIIEALNVKKIYLVDNYIHNHRPEREEQAEKLINSLDVNFEWLKMDSVMAAKHITDKLDYVYIDGDHTYEGVVRDIWAYRKLCTGLFSGHDYHNQTTPGVKQAVDEFVGKVNTCNNSNDWWVS